jgi:hypothetical protein
MPRLAELRALSPDLSNLRSFFQGTGDPIQDEPGREAAWLAWERELQRLDLESWQFLKNEACPYLMTQEATRFWEQLISIALNQARAYNYLTDIGCRKERSASFPGPGRKTNKRQTSKACSMAYRYCAK